MTIDNRRILDVLTLFAALALGVGCDQSEQTPDHHESAEDSAVGQSSQSQEEDSAVGDSSQSQEGYREMDFSAQVKATVAGDPVPAGEPGFDPICPTGPNQYLTGRTTTTGSSNVFGDFTEEQVVCVSLTMAELIHGRSTLTDEQGDTVTYHFNGLALQGYPNEPPPNHTIIGVFEIVEGTGRWSGISGSGIVEGHGGGPESPGTRSGTYEGTVYLPHL